MLIFQKSICCFFPPFLLWMRHLTHFHLFCLFKTPASSFPFLCLSPSFLPACPLSPVATPPHTHTLTFTPFLGLFFGGTCHFSCRFLTLAQDMKGLFSVLWSRNGGAERWEKESDVCHKNNCLFDFSSVYIAEGEKIFGLLCEWEGEKTRRKQATTLLSLGELTCKTQRCRKFSKYWYKQEITSTHLSLYDSVGGASIKTKMAKY